MKLAVLTNRIPIYRYPIFAALAQCRAWELKIFVSMPAAASDPAARKNLPLHYSQGWNIRYKTIHKENGTSQVESLPVPVKLLWDLMTFKPDVIISGEFGLRSVIALFVAQRRGVPLILWSEETAECAKAISGAQQLLRRFLLPKASAFLAWGNPACEYLRTWQVPEEKIFYCTQAVDNDYWRISVERVDRTQARNNLGLSGKVFLAVGQLIPRKGFSLFLQAWGDLPQQLKEQHHVVIVGKGEQETELRSLVQKLNISNVHFPGFKAMDELSQYYAAADVFVFPSLVDVWGLVVNEALACGLPVLASKYAGASHELIRDFGAGEIIDPKNISAFTAVLRRWCEDINVIPRETPRRAVEKYTFEVSINTIVGLLSGPPGLTTR